jgi:hypothetical protein
LVDIEKYLVGEAARNTTLAEFALSIEAVVRVKLVGIARQVGVVTDRLRFVLFTTWPRAGTIDCRAPISPSWNVSGACPKLSGNPPVNGSSYSG